MPSRDNPRQGGVVHGLDRGAGAATRGTCRILSADRVSIHSISGTFPSDSRNKTSVALGIFRPSPLNVRIFANDCQGSNGRSRASSQCFSSSSMHLNIPRFETRRPAAKPTHCSRATSQAIHGGIILTLHTHGLRVSVSSQPVCRGAVLVDRWRGDGVVRSYLFHLAFDRLLTVVESRL